MIDLNDVGELASPDFDLDEIRNRLRSQAAQIYPGLFPNALMSRDKRSMRCADLSGRAPRNEASCIIHLAGPRAGTGHDFATEDHAGPIDLVEWATGLTGVPLFQECARLVGLDPARLAPKWKQQRQDAKPAKQRDISREVAGTLGETYLAGRGLQDPGSDDLQFHPDLTDFETRRGYFGIVATVRNGAGEPMGSRNQRRRLTQKMRSAV
jgi:putative DNA primase/helicase